MPDLLGGTGPASRDAGHLRPLELGDRLPARRRRRVQDLVVPRGGGRPGRDAIDGDAVGGVADDDRDIGALGGAL